MSHADVPGHMPTWELNLVLTPIKLFACLLQPHCLTSDLLSCQLTAVHKCLCLRVCMHAYMCVLFSMFTQSTSWPASEPWPPRVQSSRVSLFVVALSADGRAQEGWDSSPLLRLFHSTHQALVQIYFHLFPPLCFPSKTHRVFFSSTCCSSALPRFLSTGEQFLPGSADCLLQLFIVCAYFWRGLFKEPYPFLDKWNSLAHCGVLTIGHTHTELKQRSAFKHTHTPATHLEHLSRITYRFYPQIVIFSPLKVACRQNDNMRSNTIERWHWCQSNSTDLK